MTDPCVVVRVRPQLLARALANLENQACECWAPRALVRLPHSRRQVVVPLFPGYVFVWPPGQQWAPIRSTRGVLGVLMADQERPYWLPGSEVDRLRAREGPDGLVHLSGDEFVVGEHVRVDLGGSTLDAVVDGMTGRDRVAVLMEILGRWVRMDVSSTEVVRRS
jgi:transcription antitermination factor NusG